MVSEINVIIPCYNHGNYLNDAVESVFKQSYKNFEIIIVNDGSTDKHTIDLLNNYDREKVKIIHTKRQGLASARNNGIKEGKGKYILPLDADDMIGRDYLQEAVRILDKSPNIGIVYCQAKLFGHVNRNYDLPDYSLKEMLTDNIIFCSGVFRRKDWEIVGGYNSNLNYGWEDYDFWLSLIERNVKVYQIPRILFYYRISKDSMARSCTNKQKVEMFKQIFWNHRQLFENNIEIWIQNNLKVKEFESRILLLNKLLFKYKIIVVKRIFEKLITILQKYFKRT